MNDIAKQHYTISRYETSATWHAAIQPADRKWVLYVDRDGKAYLYERAEDVESLDGDTLERYTLASPERITPGVLTIRVGPTGHESIHPYVAASDTRAAGGATLREAVVALLDYLPATPPR